MHPISYHICYSSSHGGQIFGLTSRLFPAFHYSLLYKKYLERENGRRVFKMRYFCFAPLHYLPQKTALLPQGHFLWVASLLFAFDLSAFLTLVLCLICFLLQDCFSPFVLWSFDVSAICFHLCRVSGENYASHCWGWQTVPPHNLHLSAGILQLVAAAEWKPFSPRAHSKHIQPYFCRRGWGNGTHWQGISRGLQGQFYCGKCLLVISGEWDIDYIDRASCMNWNDIELIGMIQ